MKCKHDGPRLIGGHRTVCGACGETLADADPRIVAIVDELYARPPTEVAATFIMLGIDASKAGWR